MSYMSHKNQMKNICVNIETILIILYRFKLKYIFRWVYKLNKNSFEKYDKNEQDILNLYPIFQCL